jgi:hypothetical protein
VSTREGYLKKLACLRQESKRGKRRNSKRDSGRQKRGYLRLLIRLNESLKRMAFKLGKTSKLDSND